MPLSRVCAVGKLQVQALQQGEQSVVLGSFGGNIFQQLNALFERRFGLLLVLAVAEIQVILRERIPIAEVGVGFLGPQLVKRPGQLLHRIHERAPSQAALNIGHSGSFGLGPTPAGQQSGSHQHQYKQVLFHGENGLVA